MGPPKAYCLWKTSRDCDCDSLFLLLFYFLLKKNLVFVVNIETTVYLNCVAFAKVLRKKLNSQISRISIFNNKVQLICRIADRYIHIYML